MHNVKRINVFLPQVNNSAKSFCFFEDLSRKKEAPLRSAHKENGPKESIVFFRSVLSVRSL